MSRPAITRRRALVLAVAAGAGSALAGPRRVAQAAVRPRAPGFGLTVGPADFAGRTSRVLRASRRFDLLGLSGATGAEVRVRRRGGDWSAWVPLAAHAEHAPDGDRRGDRPSDPVWTGGSHELQLRLPRAPRRALRVHFVAVPASVRRRGRRRAQGRAAQAPGTAPPIIPRAAWGGDALPPRALPRYGSVQLAFVHHTVTTNAYGPGDSAAIVFGIHRYHRNTNGWNDIGYNFLVDQFGQVFEGRAGGVDQPVIGAQAQGYNSFSTGVAQLGTHGAAQLSEAAMQATAQLLGWKLSLHGVPCEGTVVVSSGGGPSNRFPSGTPVTLNRISGHRDGNATSCPGDALYAQLPQLRIRAAALAGPPPQQPQVTIASAATAFAYGQPATFSGAVLLGTGLAAAGELVAVQKLAPSGSWVTVAGVSAGPDGTWRAELPWRRATQVRAQAVGVTSPVARVGVVPVVLARPLGRHRVAAGAAVRVSGRVRPAVPMRVLVEVRLSDGAWARMRLDRARLRGTGWAATVRLQRPGLYRLTARTLAGDAAAAPVLVRVLRPRRRRRRRR